MKNNNQKILITSVPFASKDKTPLNILDSLKVSYEINPTGRKLTENELISMIGDKTILIAGTEPITKNVLKKAKNLKLISRIGIGLDNVDLITAKKMGIEISYTPNAPAPAVSEFTIGLMISLMRSIHIANQHMHKGSWKRFFGKRFSDLTIGIIGVGRIGSRVINHLSSFDCSRILINDLKENIQLKNKDQVYWSEKDKIYRESDIISLHIPLTEITYNMISRKQIQKMKDSVMLINTSRGGIINENDLAEALNNGKVSSAAIDVFKDEPYSGNLSEIDNCLITSHMGSMSIDCRNKMEIEATEEASRFINGEPLQSKVPYEEYNMGINFDKAILV